ncbi:MAG: tetratricopeptide repeat protein [bacterium]|nr:tetratricopeptide repeat protein [bacterium]
MVLLDAGKYSEAKAPFERALAIREKVLGPEHPDVAASVPRWLKRLTKPLK